jgi:CBS domain-containing protein
MKNVLVRDVIRNYVTHTLSPEQTVDHAVRVMAQARVGAVLLVDHQKVLQGIFSERDLVSRVVLLDLPASQTKLADVMTPSPIRVDLMDSVDHALALMDQHGCRHLPVVRSDQSHTAVAMLSIRDVYRAHSQRLNEDNEVLQSNIVNLQQDVQMKNAYIFGAY